MNSKSFVITQRNGRQHTVIVDADRYDEVTQYNWCVQPNHGSFRAIRKVGKRRQKLHHFIIGHPPKGMTVDHLNRNPLDNRLCNLRFATYSENNKNRKPFSRSRSRNNPGTFSTEAQS